jgi:hypothetical protein
LSGSTINESDEDEENESQLDYSDSTFERELNAMGATVVSRGSLQICLHSTRRSRTLWFELLHANKTLNYYSSKSNQRSAFVGSIALQCYAIIPCSPTASGANSLIISHGGSRQSAPIHHIVSAPSPSALSFWLDAFTTATDQCLSRDAVELRRHKAVLLQWLDQKRLQRPSLQLIGASLADVWQPAASASSALFASSPSSQAPPPPAASLFTEEEDGGEAFRECTSQVGGHGVFENQY